jgi:hydrogenase nickel incorporation protein HypA/HybF
MHELAIAEGLVDAVTERLPGTKISEVRLEIGALSGVVADSLRFCFDLATEGTELEGASLQITEPGIQVECRTCGDTFVPDGAGGSGARGVPILLCPCGSADVKVLSGQQLTITSVKVA